MKRLFRLKYPKIILLIVISILACWIFSNPLFEGYIRTLHEFELYSTFLFGLLFSFGFTTPFSVGYFVTYTPQNIWFEGILAGFGAMIADLVIFKFVKFSFSDEFKKLKKEKITRKIDGEIKKIVGKRIQHYLMYAFAGIIIASPLPDEAGVTMLAGLTEIRTKILAAVSFIFNTLGIIIMLSIH